MLRKLFLLTISAELLAACSGMGGNVPACSISFSCTDNNRVRFAWNSRAN